MNHSLHFRTLLNPVSYKLRLNTVLAVVLLLLIAVSCDPGKKYYSYSDFKNVKKTDIHLHINSLDPQYMKLAVENNFSVLSPNVDSRLPVDGQLDTSISIKKLWPDSFSFLGTFSVDSFGKPGFTKDIIKWIDKCMAEGAAGIKIWKNIGMVLKDAEGKYVMVDDPAFDSIFNYLEEKKIPVMGHLGEPKNCWLPLEQMTDSGNYRYYKSNPQYHMFLHPEAPSYEDQINARDNLLKKHPHLNFVAAHLASLEWNVDEIATRLDMFPNMNIDMSARMAHLQYQSVADLQRVRNFLIKYQDRIAYGTDITINAGETDPEARAQALLERWKSNWIYLATDSVQIIRNISGDVKGLGLPKEVIDKIYKKNADRFFSHI